MSIEGCRVDWSTHPLPSFLSLSFFFISSFFVLLYFFRSQVTAELSFWHHRPLSRQRLVHGKASVLDRRMEGIDCSLVHYFYSRSSTFTDFYQEWVLHANSDADNAETSTCSKVAISAAFFTLFGSQCYVFPRSLTTLFGGIMYEITHPFGVIFVS